MSGIDIQGLYTPLIWSGANNRFQIGVGMAEFLKKDAVFISLTSPNIGDFC
jgi:hypothetical protein